MAININHAYLVGIMPSPVINDPPSLTSIRRYFCVVLHYDATTKTRVLLLGTSRPQQPHRFVPCLGAIRLPHQPKYVISLNPPCGLMNIGYFNFSHVFRATIFLQGDAELQQSIPPQAFITENYTNRTNIDVLLALPEVERLKSLHALYWEGLRYDINGYRLSHAPLLHPLNVDGTISLPDGLPVERGSGAERLALIKEDERMTQLALIDGDHTDLPVPSVYAFLQPLTVNVLDILDPL